MDEEVKKYCSGSITPDKVGIKEPSDSGKIEWCDCPPGRCSGEHGIHTCRMRYYEQRGVLFPLPEPGQLPDKEEEPDILDEFDSVEECFDVNALSDGCMDCSHNGVDCPPSTSEDKKDFPKDSGFSRNVSDNFEVYGIWNNSEDKKELVEAIKEMMKDYWEVDVNDLSIRHRCYIWIGFQRYKGSDEYSPETIKIIQDIIGPLPEPRERRPEEDG